MARTFRLYGKKLGNRRTGSEYWGRLGAVVMFGACYLAGCFLLAHTIHERLLPEWRVVAYFEPAPAVVLHARVAEQVERGSTFYRPEIQIRYDAGGATFTPWCRYDAAETRYARPDTPKEVVERYPDGEAVTAWYDPLQPSRAVLFRGFRWQTAFWLVLPLAFLGIGGGGLAYQYLRAGRSLEEQALVTQAQQKLAPHEVLGLERVGHGWPNVPPVRHLCNSPGTKQAWRLPVAAASSWPLGALTAVTVAVNLVVAVFVAMAVRSYWSAAPDWRLTAFALASSGLGVALLVYYLRRVFRAGAWGMTIVEISELPLRPAARYSVYVSQSARRPIEQFQLLLVCEERAAFRQGTDSIVAAQVVHQQEIVSLSSQGGPRGAELSATAELCLPTRAMHSFIAESNQVEWRLEAKGRAKGWPDLQRAFPLVVAPESPEEAAP